MSIIGPRPLLVSYLPWYTEEEKQRHDVRPGLSGLAQVNGRTISFFVHALKAKVWITNSSMEHGLCFKKKSTIYINTWHGSAIKYLGNDVKTEGKSFKGKSASKEKAFYTQSEFDEYVFKRAFGKKDDDFKRFGLPRNDELACVEDDKVMHIKEELGKGCDLSTAPKMYVNNPLRFIYAGNLLSVLSTDAIERITNQCYSVITVSDFVKSRVKSAAPGCRAVTVRNCTDLIPIPDKEVTVVKQKIRNKAEIGMKDKLFVYIGRIIPIKGVYELVRAFVSADMQNAKLLIVGAPSNRGEEIYLEKIKEIANSNVKYWGYADHDKLNELYCAADCVVAPSICQEAAPLIALEASVCRRRLIATNIGGIPEYIDKNGLLVNYDEKFVENLAKELISVNAVDDCEICSEIVSNQMESYYDDFYNALQIFDEEKNNHVKIDKYN